MPRQHDVMLPPLTRGRDEPCPPEILEEALRVLSTVSAEELEAEVRRDPRFAAEILELAVLLSARRAAEGR